MSKQDLNTIKNPTLSSRLHSVHRGKAVAMSLGIDFASTIVFVLLFMGIKFLNRQRVKRKELKVTAKKENELTLEADGGVMPQVDERRLE